MNSNFAESKVRWNHTKPQQQETHEEETRQSHSSRKCVREKQDKTKGNKNAWRGNETKSKAAGSAWRGRSQRTKNGAAEALSTCYLANAREARPTVEEEQRVLFGGGGKKPSFGILAESILTKMGRKLVAGIAFS